MNKLVRCLSEDGTVLVMAADTTELVETARRYHETSKVCSAALGRLLTAASLMGTLLKSDDYSLTLRINGGGPAGSVIAVGDPHGNVRGYVMNPHIEMPLNEKGKLDVGGALGAGILTAIKDMGLKEPYVGQVPIVSGEIAEDIANYFAVSEQIPTVCGLGVLVNPDLTVKAAGGYLIQLLPFAPESCIDILEKNVNSLPSVTQMLTSGITAEEMAMKVLEGLEPNVLDEFNCGYKCDCSKERVENALISLGREELTKMAAEGEKIEICCHFCDKKYYFTSEEIKSIRDNMVYFDTAEETGQAFFRGEVDGAATWEPYLTMAASSTDSRILFDTSASTNIVLTGLVFRKDFLLENEEFMVQLIDGAL